MLIIIISRSSLKLDHVGSKTRLLGHQATQVSDLGPLWPSCLQICFTIKFSQKYYTKWISIFRGDCQPQKWKTMKINAHAPQSESPKFGHAKIFQYRVDIFVFLLKEATLKEFAPHAWQINLKEKFPPLSKECL